MLVEKEIIGPAVHWYRDEATSLPRKLVVTPELTRYWYEQGNKMLGLGLTVPVPCEHDFNAHPMTPADKLKSNAGWVKEYRLGTPKKDGTRADDNKLFGVVDVQDEALAKKLPTTIRWTSPWISSFTDGQGREWKNVISHLALTTRPRIINQAPFGSIAAALSLATETKLSVSEAKDGLCLSKAGKLVIRKKDKKLRPQYPIAFSMFSGGIKLADDKDDMEELSDDGDDVSHEPPEFADQNGDVSMEELLADLMAALGINVDRSGGEAQFKRALYSAVMTKIHELTNKGKGTGSSNGQGNGTPPNPLIQQEQQPMYMSLEEINKIPDAPLKAIALSMYNENVKLRGELDANAKTTASLRDAKLKEENAKRNTRVAYLSRLSPRVKADLEAMLALPAMALSMGDGGVVVDPMAQTLAVLEKGLADMPRLLTTDQSALSVQPQPTDGDMLSAEASEKIADDLSRMMGCPPEQKKAG